MIEFYEVGGCIRDQLLGLESKDVDFVVVTPGGYETMKAHLSLEGFKIYLEKPEFVTIRASVPEGHPLRSRTKDADFVLARKDGPTKDGRRPEFVEPGTLLDDLARRDFTVNAMAKSIDGTIIDPHGGREDLKMRVLRFVGDPMARIKEDGLRVMRAYRFSLTKQMRIASETIEALRSYEAGDMLKCVSVERISEELEKMFSANTRGTIQLLADLPYLHQEAIFRDGLRLLPSFKGKKPVR